MKMPLLALLASLLAACAPDFIEPWDVRKPRLMVAKLSIDGDSEGRTRPRPGETFSLRYYMMSPERPQRNYTSELAVCGGFVLPNGTLACSVEAPLPDLEAEPYQGDDQLVVKGLAVPSLDDLPLGELSAEARQLVEQLDRFSLFGTVCVDGQVERVPGTNVEDDPLSTLFRCTDNDEAKYKTPMPFTLSVLLDRGGPGRLNHHPSFACDEAQTAGPCHEGVEQHGERVAGPIVLERSEKAVQEQGGARIIAWPAWDTAEALPWDDCAAAPDSLPKVRAESGEHKVRVRFDPSDREEYQREIEENGQTVLEEGREELILNHAITRRGGKLGSYASVLYRTTSDPDAEIVFEYTPPKQSDEPGEHIEAQGRLVRIYFALRDQRGGTDFTTRELCVLPPED